MFLFTPWRIHISPPSFPLPNHVSLTASPCPRPPSPSLSLSYLFSLSLLSLSFLPLSLFPSPPPSLLLSPVFLPQHNTVASPLK